MSGRDSVESGLDARQFPLRGVKPISRSQWNDGFRRELRSFPRRSLKGSYPPN